MHVWNQDSQTRVKASEYGDPCEPLKPIRLVGARNGSYSGEVVVGSSATVQGLKAVTGDFQGPGTITASKIQIRYALGDKGTNLPFEIRSPEAPDEAAVAKTSGGALMPVWVAVKVPPDAKAGVYRGTVTISLEGAAPMQVPVELRVVDWRLPDPKDFVSHIGLTQSPESVAMWYKVPLWSPEHWKLVEESFAMMGVAGDCVPTKTPVEDLKAVAPDAKWVVQAHGHTENFYGQPAGYLAEVWNSPRPPDPADKRLYGWKNPFLRTAFPRYDTFTLLMTQCTLAQYRLASESASTSGIRGFGRVGADFWNVLEVRNKTYGAGLNIIARYPQSDWGQLYLGNSTPYLLAPGPRGPLATARFEMIRAGAQDLEARVFLEKALLDPDMRAALGTDLANRCQQLLDDRVRANLIGRAAWLFFAGAQERLEKLYELAGEVAGKLGT
jgi:hypothetical protein